jgi:hypothetical protein
MRFKIDSLCVAHFAGLASNREDQQMLVSSAAEFFGSESVEDVAFLHHTAESAWKALRFAIDDEASEEAEDLRRRLMSLIVRAVDLGERDSTRIVDSVLADLPPMTARHGTAA